MHHRDDQMKKRDRQLSMLYERLAIFDLHKTQVFQSIYAMAKDKYDDDTVEMVSSCTYLST